MSIKGRVYAITKPVDFFGAINNGIRPLPQGSYSPLTQQHDFVVSMFAITNIMGLPPLPMTFSANVNPADGSFILPDYRQGLGISQIAITLQLNHNPFYRSVMFPAAKASEDLNIYVYQPPLTKSFGFTAAQVSILLANHGLPGNTRLTANPSTGLGVAGSSGEANLQFGLLLVPDTTANLGVFFDLTLNGYNISVGWPQDWCISANDIVNKIKSGLQTTGSEANVVAVQLLSSFFQAPPYSYGVNQADFMVNGPVVSVQFMYVFYASHSWGLTDYNDTTIVINPMVAIGWPVTP